MPDDERQSGPGNETQSGSGDTTQNRTDKEKQTTQGNETRNRLDNKTQTTQRNQTQNRPDNETETRQGNAATAVNAGNPPILKGLICFRRDNQVQFSIQDLTAYVTIKKERRIKMMIKITWQLKK
ncbi:hypothetical protein ACROYT_G015354 [Oculina patagonica]